MTAFKILRFFSDDNKKTKIIATGLTHEEAIRHCTSEKTHKKDKDGKVIWFDGYLEE